MRRSGACPELGAALLQRRVPRVWGEEDVLEPEMRTLPTAFLLRTQKRTQFARRVEI